MRTIFILVILGVVLVGAGVLHINYNKDSGSATVSIDKEKLKERTDEVLDEVKVLEGNAEKSLAK